MASPKAGSLPLYSNSYVHYGAHLCTSDGFLVGPTPSSARNYSCSATLNDDVVVGVPDARPWWLSLS